jgi:hypothetical protein
MTHAYANMIMSHSDSLRLDRGGLSLYTVYEFGSRDLLLLSESARLWFVGETYPKGVPACRYPGQTTSLDGRGITLDPILFDKVLGIRAELYIPGSIVRLCRITRYNRNERKCLSLELVPSAVSRTSQTFPSTV